MTEGKTTWQRAAELVPRYLEEVAAGRKSRVAQLRGEKVKPLGNTADRIAAAEGMAGGFAAKITKAARLYRADRDLWEKAVAGEFTEYATDKLLRSVSNPEANGSWERNVHAALASLATAARMSNPDAVRKMLPALDRLEAEFVRVRDDLTARAGKLYVTRGDQRK